MARLVLSLDSQVMAEYNMNKERYTIGRLPDNDIRIDNPAVSGHHSLIINILNDSFLEDLNSSGGVHLEGAAEHSGGHLVQREALHEGDRFSLGPGVVAQVERRRPGIEVATCADGLHLVEKGSACPFCRPGRELATGFVSAVPPGPEPVVERGASPPDAPGPASRWMSLLAAALVLVAVYLLFRLPG